MKRVLPRCWTGWKDERTTFEYILSPQWQADSHGREFLQSQNVSHVSRSGKRSSNANSDSIVGKRHCRPWQDSNLQSPVSETDALSIRPQGRSCRTSNLGFRHLPRFQHLAAGLILWIRAALDPKRSHETKPSSIEPG